MVGFGHWQRVYVLDGMLGTDANRHARREGVRKLIGGLVRMLMLRCMVRVAVA